MPRRLRPYALILFALCLLPLGGCVYLHLLQLKLQLGNFDRNFTVETHDGLSLTFRNPVLSDEDVESFFHWTPDTRQRSGSAEKWHFAWVKTNAKSDGDRPPTEISVDLLFVDHKLVKLHAPERFFAATMPKSLALAALKSLGHASVDKSKRSAGSTIESEDLQAAAQDPFLTERGLKAALGAPESVTDSGGNSVWTYRFTPASAHQRFGDSGVVQVAFTVSHATHHVTLMKGKTVFGEIVFDTTHIGPKDSGQMHAALPK